MIEKNILTRADVPAKEKLQKVEKVIKKVKFTYDEVYYLDYEVDENTGIIDKTKLVPHYTKHQTNRNLKAIKSAYWVAAKGAISPAEIINFREKHKIAASVLSLILGFSKNTISNIEKEGVTSLSSGRFIKICLNNTPLLSQYVQSCSSLEVHKKNILLEKLAT